MKPRLLDLFCGAGGASMGYHRAGFEVVGVDIEPQPHYPFEFVHMSALGFLEYADPPKHILWSFDAIHASPPCQRWTAYSRRPQHVGEHPDYIAATRKSLKLTGMPYVIENVKGAPLHDPIRLCGSSFGLDIQRHRYFESNAALLGKGCQHEWQTPRFPQATNRSNKRRTVEVGAWRTAKLAPQAMDIWWMTNDELSQAIPPAYTEWIGTQLLNIVRERAA